MPNLRAWRFPGSTRQRLSPLAPLLSIAAFCILSPVAAQDSRAPLYVLSNPGTSAQPEVSQGFSIAVDGTTAAVSTRSDHTGATQAGVVKIYDTTTGALQLTLTNPTPALYDHFGYSVALSGTRVVVGAIYDDTGAGDAGSVYVYDLAGDTAAVPVATLTNPSPATLDNFGSSVGVSESHVVIGSHNDDSAASDAGIAYVYELDRSKPLSSSPVLKLNKLNSSAGDAFGFAVGLDGMRVVVGAPYEDNTVVNRGAAYIFGLEPELHIVPVASGLVAVSWTPTNTPGFALQYTDGLKSGLWLDAMGDGVPPAIFPSTNSSRFYRLFKR